jgi:hypothetical protein
MQYIFYSDPGHGWLRVKMQELRDLGIMDKITFYSYMSKDGKYAYLEEDVDADTFILTKWGTYEKARPHIKESNCNRYSSIRRKTRFSPTVV